MAAPPVINNDQLPLTTHCLEFTKALVTQGVSFHFSITAGSFSFSFDNAKGNRNSDTAWTPAKPEKTRKTPSTLRRNARRRELFLKKKSETLSSIPSSQTQINHHPQSQDNCHSSHDYKDVDNKVVRTSQNMRKGDWISFPRSHSPIHQLDGNSDPCGEDDDQSQLNDTNDTDATNDTNVDNNSDILCPMCSYQMTPTHQCCEPESSHDKDSLRITASAEEGMARPRGNNTTIFGIPIHDTARIQKKIEEEIIANLDKIMNGKT